MATRFYLPSSGTPPLASLGGRSDWEQTTGLVRLPTKTSKQNTALTSSNRTWPSTATQQWAWYQFQSEQLLSAYSWTTADTVSMVLGKLAETSTGGDTHLAYIIRVVSADGTIERGVIGLYHATSTEFALTASAATRIHSARTDGATAFNSQIGDRIIIEIGVHGVTPAAESIQMRVGDPTATADFALTAALTTDLCSWVELSRNVSLGTIVDLSIADCANSSTIDAIAITQTHILTVSDLANSSTEDNITITQTHKLTLSDLENSNTIDGNLVLEQFNPAVNLTVSDLANSSSIDSVTITQIHLLTVQDAFNSSIIDNISITQTHKLVVSDAENNSTLDNIQLTQTHILAFNDLFNQSSLDNVSITQVHQLLTDDLSNQSTIDGDLILTLTAIIDLIVQDLSNQSSIDSIQITQFHNVVLNNLSNQSTVDNILLSQIHNILVNDLNNSNTIDLITINQIHELITSDLSNESIIDNLTIIALIAEIISLFLYIKRTEQINLEIKRTESLNLNIQRTFYFDLYLN